PNATIATRVAKPDKPRPLVDVASIRKYCHLHGLGHRPAVLSSYQRRAVSVETVAIVAAEIVGIAQRGLQIKRDLIVALDEGRFVAGAERETAHSVGESEVVFRLGSKQIKGIRVPGLVPELCVLRIELEAGRIAESLLPEVEIDEASPGD